MQGLKNQDEDKLSKLDKLSKEEKSAEKDTLGKRLKKHRDRFKLGPHHRMERFMIMFGTTAGLMIIFVISGFFANQAKISNLQAETAVITDNFTYSLSGQKGTVEKVFANKDQSDVIYLFKMRNIDNMSTNTENYEMFVTSEKRKGISYNPDISYGLFGSTGYGFIRVENDSTIPQEMLSITLRSNEKLTTGSSTAPNEDDESFNKYDQAQILMNPGAKGIEIHESLDSFDPSNPIDLYTSLIAKDIDDEIHEEIDEELENLQNLLAKNKEYAGRIAKGGYVPPEEPWFIKGDVFDEDGVFIPKEHVNGAHDITYQGVTVKDGYLKQVMGDISEYDKYINDHKEKTNDNVKAREKREQVDRITMVEREDGSEIELNSISPSTSPSAQVEMRESVNSLQGVWRDYVKTKIKVERDLVTKLLILDADALSQDIGFSVIDGTDYVTFY